MKDFSLSRIAQLVGGKLVGEDAPVCGFATDSNDVRVGDLFLAIKGARVDGHDFVPAILEKGAAGTLAERSVPGPHVLVPNLVDALARMASKLREPFTGPVIGVTGSAGKTTTKELIAAAISPLGPILKTEGNRNTEYTAPLIWAELGPEHRAAIVEMSMRGFGQIRHLAGFSRPTIGVVTNVGYAHVEMVGSRLGIAQAKGELLEAIPEDGVAVLWNEGEFLVALRDKAGDRRVATFGVDPGADSRLTDYRVLDWTHCLVSGSVDGSDWQATVPAVGRHVALNAAAAMMVAKLVGVDVATAAEALAATQFPPMRMQVLEFRGASVLLDTYNASPPSMIAAIQTLGELPASGRRRAVIGDMRELGGFTEASHRELGRELAKSNLDEVLFVGDSVHWCLEEAGANGPEMRIAADPSEVRRFLSDSRPGDAVLVKGSRALELEKALENLD